MGIKGCVRIKKKVFKRSDCSIACIEIPVDKI